MQLNQNQYDMKTIKQLLNSQDPEALLLDRYSSLLENHTIELEVSKLYLHFLNQKKQRQNILAEIEDLKEKIKQLNRIVTPKKVTKEQSKSLKEQQNSFSNQNTNKLKRTRRNANQISRHFQCPVDNCKKQYGSQGSLNQHIKLKHQFLVKNYENWAFEIKKQQQ